jgi:hypothetical protein
MLLDCPHCHRRVLPMSDFSCPACRGDTRAETVDDRSEVRLAPGDDLPPLCMACGQPTIDRVSIQEQVTIGGHSWLFQLFLMLTSPSWFAADRRAIEGKTSQFSMRIPVCKTCQGRAELQPSYVNFEHRTATFLVHGAFARALREQRGVKT